MTVILVRVISSWSVFRYIRRVCVRGDVERTVSDLFEPHKVQNVASSLARLGKSWSAVMNGITHAQ